MEHFLSYCDQVRRRLVYRIIPSAGWDTTTEKAKAISRSADLGRSSIRENLKPKSKKMIRLLMKWYD